jgi:hypothetical protein
MFATQIATVEDALIGPFLTRPAASAPYMRCRALPNQVRLPPGSVASDAGEICATSNISETQDVPLSCMRGAHSPLSVPCASRPPTSSTARSRHGILKPEERIGANWSVCGVNTEAKQRSRIVTGGGG